ncbi:hypothetical protein MNBD_CHLOROFLEXI01-4846 [hydrothermal vent metagenome]|uniref:Histidine kinase n=1 Tax=hydrothermal vent metagenome TaxID=652676 RepID=A0A3B0W603_9ZZZZ
MPQLNGYDVCQQLKQNEARQHIPIILITALNGREDMLRGLASGADEFLPKPVNGEELRARVRTMLRIKNQYDTLQVLMQFREDLAHMLIHDMRNPLTVASLYNDILLKQNGLASREKKYAHVVRDSLRELAGFLDEILLVAKMEQGMLQLDSSLTDIAHLVAEVANNHREIAQLHGFQLTLDMPDCHRLVLLDTSLFKRVLDNLLSNAFKYTSDNGEVTIHLRYPLDETAASTHSFYLQIIDEGPGIAPEDRERIFDRFEVVSMKQNGQTQVGLGLAFCKMVVNAHNGRIYMTPNHPQGSIFHIEM